MPKQKESQNRKYPQEMLLMGGCPNCGQEVNREFLEKTIDEIAGIAILKERKKIIDELMKLTSEDIDFAVQNQQMVSLKARNWVLVQHRLINTE